MNQRFNTGEDAPARAAQNATLHRSPPSQKRKEQSSRAIWQARLVLLVMINIAQLWTLSGTVEAALAHEFSQLLPHVIASILCWLIALSIFLWWRPASRRFTSTGYLREK